MMKNKILKTVALSCLGAMTLFPSCEDFLDRPAEDRPSCNEFYQTEEELKQGVNPLYCISWFSFQRMWIDAGDNLAGNYGKGSSDIYTTLNMSDAGSNSNLTNGFGALYAVVNTANIAMKSMSDYSPLPEEVQNKYRGECYLFKALAYFYLVRIWGEVPIIDDNVKIISEGGSYGIFRNTEEDVYKYTIALLQHAAELLPETNDKGRVDKYSAYGLLSKVYLYYACLHGKDKHLLEQSVKYGEMVEKSAHSELMVPYGKLFRAEGETCPETLIALHWGNYYDPYPCININHCDLSCLGLNEMDNGAWGQWAYVTRDLIDLFEAGPSINEEEVPYGKQTLRPDSFQDENLTVAEGYDQRRAATMCMYHDYIPFWQRDKYTGAPDSKKGFYATWNFSAYDKTNEVDISNGWEWVFPSGAAPVKQIHGSIADHIAEYGVTPTEQGSCTPMILLRTADVYLCMGEAYYHMGDEAKAKEYIGKVRTRAGVGDKEYSLDMKFIIDERRRELAFEGDNYYDYRRWALIDESGATNYILSQNRNSLKSGYFGDEAAMMVAFRDNPAEANDYSEDVKLSLIPKNTKGEPFLLGFPNKDIDANPNLSLDNEAQPYDFSQLSFYDPSKI